MHVNILQAVARMQFVLVLLAAQESHTSPLCHIFSPNLKMRQITNDRSTCTFSVSIYKESTATLLEFTIPLYHCDS